MRRLRAAGGHFQAGATAQAQVLLESTLDDLPPGPLQAIASMLLGGICVYENSFADATRHLQHAIDHADDTPALSARLLVTLSFVQGMAQGRHDEALATARAAVAMAEKHGRPGDLSQALTQLVLLTFMSGAPPADEQLRRATELEDLTSDVSVQFCASAVDALLLALRGHLDEAETKMFAVRRHYLDRGAERDLMAIAGYRTMFAMWQGRFEDASAIADEALERSEQLGGNSINVIPLSVRAAVAAYTGRDDDARRDAGLALDAARRSSGSKPRWHSGQANLVLKTWSCQPPSSGRRPAGWNETTSWPSPCLTARLTDSASRSRMPERTTMRSITPSIVCGFWRTSVGTASRS